MTSVGEDLEQLKHAYNANRSVNLGRLVVSANVEEMPSL